MIQKIDKGLVSNPYPLQVMYLPSLLNKQINNTQEKNDFSVALYALGVIANTLKFVTIGLTLDYLFSL